MTAAEVFPSVNTFINNVSILIFGPASTYTVFFVCVCEAQGFGAGAAPSRGIWLEPDCRRRHFGPAPAPP